MIHLDISGRSVLAVCDRCAWLELVTHVDIAHRISLDHLWSVHPEDRRAIDTVGQRKRRGRVAASNL